MASVAGHRVDRRPGEGVRLRARLWFRPIGFRYRVLASATGYAVSGFVAWFLVFNYPGWAGQDVDVWVRVGENARDGVSPYAPGPWASLFFFAPPWAVVLGAISWVGKPVLWALITLAEIASLRYIAGSWLRVGYFGLFFLTGAEIVSGAFNLVIAAALAAAIRGHSGPAAFVALAKVSPVLAIRDWRAAAVVISAAALITIPVFGWWFDWMAFLIGGWGGHPQDGFHGSLVTRLLLAGGILVLWRSPRAGALAAAVAIPILYPISAVLFFALFTPAAGAAERAIAAPEQARAGRTAISARYFLRC